MSRTRGLLLFFAGALFAPAAALEAATVNLFTNPADFAAQLGVTVVDSYDSPAYSHGDIADATIIDIFSNAAMSAVLGQTDYETTGFDNRNIIQQASQTYCAGCNGSFRLTFTSTSVGGPGGVFGVGFLFSGSANYLAHVVFGDGTSVDQALPIPVGLTFFGLTSPQLIQSIHFGGAGGGATTDGFFGIDDLTIGSAAAAAAVPEPGSLGLLGAGLLGMGLLRRRGR